MKKQSEGLFFVRKLEYNDDMKTPSKITNILLGIIAIMLIILVVVLIYKKRVSSPMMENPDPVHSASEKDIELLGISDKTVEFVHTACRREIL
jgi:uncharacterized protein YoxC